MSKHKKSGKATQSEATAPNNEPAEGSEQVTTALTVVNVEPLPPNPLNERLEAAKELAKLIEKRKRLAAIAREVDEYEATLNGNDEVITLQTTASHKELEISKPETVARVVAMLKADVAIAQHETDNAILAIAV